MRWALILIALGQHTVFMRQYTMRSGICDMVPDSMAQDVKKARLKVMIHHLLLETL